MSYTITRKPGRAGPLPHRLPGPCPADDFATAVGSHQTYGEVRADGPVVGVDLNDGHLALRRLDAHGNPVGRPARIDVDLSGRPRVGTPKSATRSPGCIHYARRHGIDTIAVEDLDFADARTVGRETMGSGQRGKRFRKTVASIRPRCSVTGCPRRPADTASAQGFTARRREGVTRTRPEDRAVRATNQAAPESQQATREPPPARDTGNHIPPTRPGEETRQLSRATVTPATANNGQLAS